MFSAQVGTSELSVWEPARQARLIAALSGVVFLTVVLRFAWISDDAFIAFRAAANLVHGQGLVSNPPERVQGFTNPLWALLLALGYSVVRRMYWVALLFSLAAALGLTALIWRKQDGRAAIASLLLLTGSTSFVTFSTSGLENGLAHLLVAAFVLNELDRSSRRDWLPWLLAGLIALNRLDHTIVVLPALAMRAWRLRPKRAAKLFALGFSPLLVWLAFSLVYYGFPWPNTAYAKLNTSVPIGERLMQGFAYFADVAFRDAILPLVIAAAAIFVVRERRSEPAAFRLMLGVSAYLGYVAWIGGDFMGGRFFTLPFLVAALLTGEVLARAPTAVFASVLGVAVFWGRWGLAPLPVDKKTDCGVPPSGIVDERACYVEHTGIAQNFRSYRYETHPYFKQGIDYKNGEKTVVATSLVGMTGYAAGPRVHLVDLYALNDPLLARIRFRGQGDWRIGHFGRTLPAGYIESLESGENRVVDPCLHSLYSDLTDATRGSLFSVSRWRAIFRLNVTRTACADPS